MLRRRAGKASKNRGETGTRDSGKTSAASIRASLGLGRAEDAVKSSSQSASQVSLVMFALCPSYE